VSIEENGVFGGPMEERQNSIGVLVVEDDDLVARTLEAFLLDLGFDTIYVAPDLPTADAFLLEKTPGLGVLDVNIGPHLVFSLAAGLRERRVPIVFSTGWTRAEFPPEWSIHPILQKPYSRTALISALRAAGVELNDPQAAI
jgi:DNA-binding response OmpR family regulator